MAPRRVHIGQHWKKNDTGEVYLVTKLYNEALATVAVLRKAGAETESALRVKVERSGGAQNLPGFSLAQSAEDF